MNERLFTQLSGTKGDPKKALPMGKQKRQATPNNVGVPQPRNHYKIESDKPGFVTLSFPAENEVGARYKARDLMGAFMWLKTDGLHHTIGCTQDGHLFTITGKAMRVPGPRKMKQYLEANRKKLIGYCPKLYAEPAPVATVQPASQPAPVATVKPAPQPVASPKPTTPQPTSNRIRATKARKTAPQPQPVATVVLDKPAPVVMAVPQPQPAPVPAPAPQPAPVATATPDVNAVLALFAQQNAILAKLIG